MVTRSKQKEYKYSSGSCTTTPSLTLYLIASQPSYTSKFNSNPSIRTEMTPDDYKPAESIGDLSSQVWLVTGGQSML
jgi:hypothetical protein